MLISLRRKFIFVANLKTASTAIEVALRPVSDIALFAPGLVKHQPFRLIEARFKWLFSFVDLQEFLIFAVIREPVDFLISLYNSHKEEKFRRNPQIYTGNISFSQFLEKWSRDKNWQIEQQHLRFIGSTGIGTNFVISYDKLSQGLKILASRLGTENLNNLPRDNVSQKFLTRDELTDAQVDWINTNFSGDYQFITKYCDRLLTQRERESWMPAAQGYQD